MPGGTVGGAVAASAGGAGPAAAFVGIGLAPTVSDVCARSSRAPAKALPATASAAAAQRRRSGRRAGIPSRFGVATAEHVGRRDPDVLSDAVDGQVIRVLSERVLDLDADLFDP